MKPDLEWLKNTDLIGPIATNMLAGAAAPLINIAIGAFGNGLTKAIEKIDTERTRKEIFKKSKEEAKKALPELVDEFEKLSIGDLPKTFLRFKDEEVFCTENPELCKKITEDGCKRFYRIIMEEFSRYAHKSDEFWQEYITQLIQDQSEEIKKVREEIEKKGKEEKEFWENFLDDYFKNLKPKPIEYYPEDPPDVTDFVNRDTEQINLEGLIRRKKHMIIIQGIAGIGKTQIAAKLMENIKKNIKNDYITYWKEMRNVDTFDSVKRNLAGFLRKNNDSELADYIEDDGTDHEKIINMLLSSLKEKQYALFFDNYQVVENKEVHDLFKRFKDKLTNSTIIITTRVPPQFVNPVDKIQNKLEEENVEGFNSEATREYFKQKGVEASQEQLVKIDQKIGGHPLSLLMFASLSLRGEKEIDEIIEGIENLPETEIGEYLYDEIYTGLSKAEKEVLKALSVFRTAVTADACIQVSKTDNVKEILLSLIRKLIVKRKKKLYYLHDLIREFSYNQIDNPREYHKRAGEYYYSLEKTPENITETCYHLIKYYGAVSDRIIEYLMDTPADAYTHFVVLNILDENKVESLKFFDLIKKILDIGSVDIKRLTITSLVNNKELDINKTIGIIEEIINRDENSDITYFAIYNLSDFTDILPERVLGILNGIIKNPKEKKYVYAILNMLQDSGFKHDGTISILKQIIYSDSVNINLIHRRTAYNILEDWGIALPDISKVDPNIFREMNVEEVFEFIDKYLSAEKKVIFINDSVLHFILCELYKINPDVSSEFMKKYLKIPASPNFEQISEVLANPVYYNPEIINDFLAEKNDWIIRFTGFMALEFNINNEFNDVPVGRHEETKKVSISILKNLLNDRDPFMSEMAKVAYDRATKPKKIEKTKIGQKIKNKVTRKMMNLVDLKMIQVVRYLVAGFELTTQHQTLLFWLLYNAILPNTNPTETFGLLHVAGKAGVIEKNIVQFVYNEVKNDPCDAIEILNKFGIKSDYFMSRVGAIVGIDMLGRICPEKALETYESLLSTIERELKFVLLGSGSTGLLRNFRDRPEGPEKERIKSILKRLKQDEDKEVSAFADMILSGIQFKDAC